MGKFRTFFEQLKKPTSISIAVVFAIVVIVLVTSWLLYTHTVSILTQNLRDRLLTISITQAANIDPAEIDALRGADDWKKPEWAHVVNRLHKAKYSNDQIVFIYIFRKTNADPLKMEFVADADSIDPYANIINDPTGESLAAAKCPKCVDSNRDGKIERNGPDKLQWPGQPFPEIADIPESFDAYNGAVTVKDIYTDEYGSVLTGFAPIKDNEGNTVAVLGTDIKAGDFLTITRQTLYPFLAFIAGLTIIISALAAALIYIWSRRANMLAKLSASLEIANRRQESLLHFISHEIKGYLTKGQNAFAGIIEGDYGEVSEQVQTLSKEALKEMRAGVSTTMEILAASNMKKGTMSFEKNKFDLRNATLEIADQLRAIAEKKGLSLEVLFAPSGAYTIEGDETKIRQHVLRNLIDNSIRYTETGHIKVSLSRENEKIRFSVSDSGVGISEEDKVRLFTEGGHGTDSIKVNVDSTGYGLFVAKQVVDAHGGKIWAESEGSGKGSTFFAEFPAA